MNIDSRVKELLAARRSGVRVSREPDLSMSTAYDIAAAVRTELIKSGHRPVGRKVGFTNQATWMGLGLDEPIWSTMYDTTVTATPAIDVTGLPEPRLEPEVVLCLARDVAGPPTPDDIAWSAIGAETVASHHECWRFNPAEGVADFGLHALLVVGPRLEVKPDMLPGLTVTMTGPGGTARSQSLTGQGVDVLGGPLKVLAALATLPGASPLRAGELIATGTLVPPPAIERGQRWSITVEGGSQLVVTT